MPTVVGAIHMYTVKVANMYIVLRSYITSLCMHVISFINFVFTVHFIFKKNSYIDIVAQYMYHDCMTKIASLNSKHSLTTIS